MAAHPLSVHWRVWLFLSAVIVGAIIILAAFKRQPRNSHGIEEPGPIERKDQ